MNEQKRSMQGLTFQEQRSSATNQSPIRRVVAAGSAGSDAPAPLTAQLCLPADRAQGPRTKRISAGAIRHARAQNVSQAHVTQIDMHRAATRRMRLKSHEGPCVGRRETHI